MVRAVQVHDFGGPEVMRIDEIELPAPGKGEVLVRFHAAGVNFIDTYYRTGAYKPPSMPFVPGSEGAGEVVALGKGVKDFKEGDRVVFVGTLGCYAEQRIVPADRLVKLSKAISYETAAAMMLKGLTAQYLLRQTYKVRAGDTILVHAAAGGVGLILCQWGRALGATVIGTAGTREKAALAKKAGAKHVILYRDEDFVARVKDITKGKLCDVVYDGVGKTTFPASLDCLRPLRYVCELRLVVGQGRRLRHQPAGAEGLAVRDTPGAVRLHRRPRQPPQDGEGPDAGRGEPARSALRSTRPPRSRTSSPSTGRSRHARRQAPPFSPCRAFAHYGEGGRSRTRCASRTP